MKLLKAIKDFMSVANNTIVLSKKSLAWLNLYCKSVKVTTTIYHGDTYIKLWAANTTKWIALYTQEQNQKHKCIGLEYIEDKQKWMRFADTIDNRKDKQKFINYLNREQFPDLSNSKF